MAPLRMTLTAQLVLRALLADPHREVYGREVMQAASLASGTVYPILARFQAQGWLTVREEAIDKHAEGRPKRRYYKLTEKGTEEATAAMGRAATRLAALGMAEAPPQGGSPDGRPVDDATRSGDASEAEPGPETCEHPKVHVKGVCPDCQTYVARKP